MTLRTTPLQFGYFLALSLAVLLWLRGRREERLSDTMLGWIMFLLAQEIQDYTFGFAGINFLWDQLNGFPRGIALLFGPAVYFYLKSQVNRQFKFTRKHLIHLIPWAFFFIIGLSIFVQGKYAVQAFQESVWHDYQGNLHLVVMFISYNYYYYKSIKLYQAYRKWAVSQFSDIEIISFTWFRNLVYFMIAGLVFKLTMNVIDYIYDLPFYQDWWWNLGTVVVIFYVGIWGYSQPQPNQINFETSGDETLTEKFEPKSFEVIKSTSFDDDERLKAKIKKTMEEHRAYLDANLTLSELAKRLKTNSSALSSVINQHLGKNFNDFVNEYRVEAFKENVAKVDNQNYTLLAVALDCGFNSKATFNRAFKKFTGISPREYVNKKPSNC